MQTVNAFRVRHGMTTPFDSETELQRAVEQWFKSFDLPFVSQPKLENGSIPDIALVTGSEKWGFLEIKNDLNTDQFCLKDAADYFEQCFKYQQQTNLPVFLGPFFIPTFGLSGYFSGGSKPKTIAAFSALAGRVNIGLFFIKATPGYEKNLQHWSGFKFTLRQKTVAGADLNDFRNKENLWPDIGNIVMASHLGAASNKVRG